MSGQLLVVQIIRGTSVSSLNACSSKRQEHDRK